MKKRRTPRCAKITKSRDAKSLNYNREKQKVIQTLQQMNLEDDVSNSNDVEHSLLCVTDKARTPSRQTSTFSKEGSTFSRTDSTFSREDFTFSREESTFSEDFTFLRDSSTFDESNMSFIGAIDFLKSVISCISQLPIKQLQQIFNEQWNEQNYHAYSPPEGLIESPATSREAQINRMKLASICASEKINCVVRSNGPEESSLKSAAIPAMDKNLSFNSDLNVSETETFDSSAELQMYFKPSETIECLTQPTSRNCTKRIEQKATPNMTDIESGLGNDFSDDLLFWETQTANQKAQHKPTSSVAKQSAEMNSLSQSNPFSFSEDVFKEDVLNEDFFTAVTITPPTPHNPILLTFNYSPKNLMITPPENMSQNSIDLKLDEPHDFENFQTRNRLRSPTDIFNDNRDTFDININDFDKCNTSVSNVVTRRTTCDSACNTEVNPSHRVGEMANSADESYDNTRHYYNLQSFKEKETATISTESSSIKERKKKSPCSMCEEQSSVKKRKCGRPRKWSSAKWMDFNLESLNMAQIVLESVKVILTIVSDEKTAEEHATSTRWKDNNMIREALNTVLNVSNALRLERKPDICRKPIITTVTEALDEIVQSNKTYMSHVYRMQIILELCNSVSVNIDIIDHLIAKLNSFRSILNQKTHIQRDIYGTINQLYLLFYALNIALRKYRTAIPNDRKARATILHVADLWKTLYIDKEFRHEKSNVTDAEERWRAVLKNFMMASMGHFVQFAKKSQSLVHVLNSVDFE